MTGLIILLLIAAAVVYAVFFLIFKVIWMIIKKQSNKWPLILAGICTLAFGAAVIGGTMWGVYKVVKPFSGLIERVQENPQPVYGERTYTDPEYGFDLTVFNGMDFSDWIHVKGADFKLGIDTNAFKKDNAGKNAEETVTMAAIARLQNEPGQTSVDALEEGLKNNKDRRLEINEMRASTVDGNPALYVSGTLYSNKGDSVPTWLMAVENGGFVYYVAAMEIAEQPSLLPEQMVQSLRFPADK